MTLLVRRVVLYKNGVGYFEHSARITGSQTLSLDFTSAQLDDVLQSFTALNLSGGRGGGVSYNSTSPLAQRLGAIPLGLGPAPSTDELYVALRGARVSVSGVEAPPTGRVVNLELRTEQVKDTPVEHRLLTVTSDTGAIRILELTPAVHIQLLDPELDRELAQYPTCSAASAPARCAT